jgi:multiple sugar transport system permease protein
MMRNVIAITVMFSLIGSFSGFTLVEILTNGGPLGATQVLGTLSFLIGILSGNLPMGAAIALFMVPILAVAATFILRGVGKRGSEV